MLQHPRPRGSLQSRAGFPTIVSLLNLFTMINIIKNISKPELNAAQVANLFKYICDVNLSTSNMTVEYCDEKDHILKFAWIEEIEEIDVTPGAYLIIWPQLEYQAKRLRAKFPANFKVAYIKDDDPVESVFIFKISPFLL